ncbi:MAG: hypothetical protein NTU97_03970 [Candidatus Magasanikbacteria bacterium]|nr:hypothetical protein [Candidatus Magasanikbacteria bacterium]
MATIGGPDSRDLGQENPERIRQSSEYKTFEGIFKDLSIPKTAKKYSGLYESQADFIRVLKQEMEKWGQGPRQEAAKLFIVDFESKIKGGKKGGRETIATDEEEESGGGKKGRKNKERKPKRGEEAAVVDMGATAKDLGIATKVPREVLTVEAVALVNEAVQEQEAETGHPITLAEYRQLIMDWFPRLAVRTGGENRKTNEQYSNLDGNACLFLFRQVFGFAEGTPAEQDYVFKEVAYVAPGTFQPGALNMDTSPGLHGIEIDDVAFYIDHHGIDSPRESSAFQILYEEFKREGMDKHLSPEDRTALDRLSEFVTAVDSYSLPPGQTWEKSWQLSYNTIFGLATSYQNEVRVSILFDFFKQHTLEEAFTLPIDKTTEPYLQGFRDLVEEDRREKTKTNNFVLDVKTSPTSVGFAVAIPGLGKILVHRQEVSKDKRTTNKKRGLQMAALAAGYDGILVFDEKKKSVFLAVGANTEITEDIAQRIKADLLVRKSLLKKSSKEGEEELTLAAVLLGLGANKEGLPVLIKRQMEEIEGKASTSATTPDVPPVETTKGMPTGTETGGAGPGPATPEVPSGTEPGGKKETLPEEKFKKYILDSLQAGNGRISPGVLANESFIHDVVTYWDTFSAAVKEYRDTTGEIKNEN